jgi:tight adherence protein C
LTFLNWEFSVIDIQFGEWVWLALLFSAFLMLILAFKFYKSELDDAQEQQQVGQSKSDKLLALPFLSIALGAPIAWVSLRIKNFVGASMITKVNAKLSAAGLDGSLSAMNFIAMKLLVGLFCFFLVFGFLLMREGALGMQATCFALIVSCASFWLPDSWLRDVGLARRNRILRVLPFFIDLLKIAIEAGSNMQGALQYAVAYGPAGPLRNEFSKVLSDIRSGRSRAQALHDFSQRTSIPAVAHLCAAITTAEKQGASLGSILQAQAEQRRQERFAAAETAAMKAPVKMLGPLVLFIFPGTFIILFFPVVVRLFQEGLIR